MLGFGVKIDDVGVVVRDDDAFAESGEQGRQHDGGHDAFSGAHGKGDEKAHRAHEFTAARPLAMGAEHGGNLAAVRHPQLDESGEKRFPGRG